MNLEFNIAVHILSFLVKHAHQQFSSQSFAKLTCLNPVQLRRVTTVLNQHQLIETSRDKNGGYSANHLTSSVKLSLLYRTFVLEKESQQRVFTGHEQSECGISRNIAKTMSRYNQMERRVILDFYDTLTINDVINDTL